MGIVREREMRAKQREIQRLLKPGETITDAIARINEERSSIECEIEELQLRLCNLMDAHEALIKYENQSEPARVDAKHKHRPETMKLGEFM